MIRSFSIALAVVALALASHSTFASGHTSKSHNQSVRIKNNGSAPVLVNAKNGSATGAAGAKTVNQNGVAKFTLKNKASQAWAADTAQKRSKTLNYSFPRSNFVYLLAASDGTTTTLTFSPPGVTF